MPEDFPMNTMLIIGVLTISTLPVYAQGQQPDPVKLKADAQNLVKIISGDKRKLQTYCEIGDVNDQLEQANQEQDTKKAAELSQKMNELEPKLGPEYAALADGLKDMDPKSQDGQEIGSIIEKLDDLCGD
jgi:flagellar motility protein MotE (MotC chaperone)